ncbi:MAG: 4-alpha-glucanotransferase, partial [Candidatus Cloacimonetes bacterium]|nr:4-alpha-glucanotransferase [Candidatus Cloacimonadota bacterium]
FNKPKARKKYHEKLENEILFHKFLQFQFYRQWDDMYAYAREKNVKIIGDIPIYVTMDSADAWANPELFQFDENLQPTRVAGVPPDYFSKTGQLWGNPLYDWDRMEKNGFTWWVKRIKHLMKLIDIIRIDHFIGFVNYWSVPAEDDTAVNGEWIEVPTIKFFNTVKKELGTLPIIAEDLGAVTDKVRAMRDYFNFPGMKILRFAFGKDMDHEFLPHNYSEDFVVYTGTHDNTTIKAWYKNASEKERKFLHKYLDYDGDDVVWKVIELAFDSRAVFAIIQMQDFLELGEESRFNRPGTKDGNWEWRVKSSQLKEKLVKKIRKLAIKTNRISKVNR